MKAFNLRKSRKMEFHQVLHVLFLLFIFCAIAVKLYSNQ